MNYDIKAEKNSFVEQHTRRIYPWSALFVLISFSACTAIVDCTWAQSRDQCYSCCNEAGYDDYYTEQCRLKCFRNPDHCSPKKREKAQPQGAGEVLDPGMPKPSQPARDAVETQSTRRQSPPVGPPSRTHAAPVESMPPQHPVRYPSEVSEPRPQTRQQPQTGQRFRWPESLDVVPGKEWEAAAHILYLNGITNQHPAYTEAVRGIEVVLINFSRSNPTGGRLPITQIEAILSRLK